MSEITNKLEAFKFYQAYNLKICSNIDLPELIELPASKAQECIIRIFEGRITEEIHGDSRLGVLWRQQDEKYLLDVRDVARYLINGKNEVIVEPYPQANPKHVRNFLLGAVFGVILNLHNIVTLSACSIYTKKGAILLIGGNSSGKSTFLTSLMGKDFSMLSDDKVALDYDKNGVIQTFFGFPEIRLTLKTVKDLNLQVKDSQFDLDLRKYYIKPTKFSKKSVPIKSVYLLSSVDNSEFDVEQIGELGRKISFLNAHVYMPNFVCTPQSKMKYFKLIGDLVKQFPMTLIKYSQPSGHLTEVIERIKGDFAK